MLHRNLGLEDPPAEGHEWKVVRSQLVRKLVHEKATEKETAVQAEELPESVWVARGWEAKVVQSCPSREDPTLGLLYAVPVRVDMLHEMEQQEKALQEKNKKCKGRAGRAGRGQLLEVPVNDRAATGSSPALQEGQR